MKACFVLSILNIITVSATLLYWLNHVLLTVQKQTVLLSSFSFFVCFVCHFLRAFALQFI